MRRVLCRRRSSFRSRALSKATATISWPLRWNAWSIFEHLAQFIGLHQLWFRLWFDLDFRSFELQVMEDDRREDHARNAHQLFANDQAEQRQPERRLDAVAHDLAVEEIFELMDDHQKDECHQGHRR